MNKSIQEITLILKNKNDCNKKMNNFKINKL